MTSPEIFDRFGAAKSLAWLTTTYGAKFIENPAANKFRLVRVDETEGPAVLKVRIITQEGTAIFNQPVANSWPDPSLTLLTGAGLQTVIVDRAAVQFTDNNGITGFGLGTGSYIRDLIDGGPHTVWILSPTLPSDGLTGIGMLGGTEHRGPLSLVFSQSQGQPSTPPTVPPPTTSSDDVYLLAVLTAPSLAGKRTPAACVQRAIQALDIIKQYRPAP